MCFPLQVFICFYVNFINTWFVCCIFILCFEFGFLLVICESYFGLIMICQLSCYYVCCVDNNKRKHQYGSNDNSHKY